MLVASLSAGMALGIAVGARSGRAEVDASSNPWKPEPGPEMFREGKPLEPAGSGGGGEGEYCIGIPATCAEQARSGGKGYVPRGCERRMPAPDAWPDAEVTLERLDVRPRAAAPDVRGPLVGDARTAGFARECYREALAARPTTAGRVTIRFRFHDRCAIHFHAVANTTGDPILADCAADSLAGTRFDEARAAISARLTLLFRRAPKRR